MKVLVLAPNGGASLSVGGGTRTALVQANRLAARGHDVCVAGFHALGRAQLEELHQVPLPGNVAIRSNGGVAAFELFRGLPVKLSPYALLGSGAFHSWMDRLIGHVDPELVVFHDDIPRHAAHLIRARRTLLYVHFPLAARTPSVIPPIAESRSRTEACHDAVLHLRSPVVDAPGDLCDEVWVNSSVTSRAVASVWGVSPTLVPPVVSNGAVPGPKGPVVLCVGTFSRGKNHREVLEAFARAAPPGWTLVLAGHARDASLVRGLTRTARGIRGNGHSARVMVDPTTPALRSLFASASVVVHAARFEPFGIAVLEGMAAGDVPLVRAADFSGAWVDLLDRGRVGWGYRSAEALEERLRRLSTAELGEPQLEARRRAEEFRGSSARALDAGLDRMVGPVAN